tara:strand:+ start:224 stop:1018 length:795 start_codon:yes stop_codon:yes gene_type:complete
MKLVLTAASAALFLAGCGGDTKPEVETPKPESSTHDSKAPNSASPKVEGNPLVTRIETPAVEPETPRTNPVTVDSATQAADNRLQFRNGIHYLPNSETPFTGQRANTYENGQKKMERSFKNGQLDGTWTKWHENGQKITQGSYKAGKMEGLWTAWHGNGQKKSMTTYRNGARVMPNGPQTTWYENGQKEVETTYSNGRQDGPHNEWYETGQKKNEVVYKDGREEGIWSTYRENGQKSWEGNYKAGELISEKDWDEEGNLVETTN